MFETLNDFLLRLGDMLLGWLLVLPRDLRLLALALVSALLLVLVRKYKANQDLLRRCANDKKRLAQLLREAKKEKNRDAVQRYRTNRSRVGLKQLGAELKPLLISILPIAFLATWAWQRLEFLPIQPGQPVEFTMRLRPGIAGQIIHLVPQDGVKSENGWMRMLELGSNEFASTVSASWRLQFEARKEPYVLQVRFPAGTYSHSLLVDGCKYLPPVFAPDRGKDGTSAVKLTPLKLLGVVPGIPFLSFPAWLVAYLALVFVIFPLTKRVFKS